MYVKTLKVSCENRFCPGVASLSGRAIGLGTPPHGTRRIVPILGGTFAGSGLKGKILAGGADQ